MIEVTPDLTNIVEAIIAIILAIVAYYQNQKKNEAVAQVAALTPGTVESKTPAVVNSLPERSWKMNDATRRWLTFDATPSNKIKIEQQIDAAELEHLTTYQIQFEGGYYNIEYGLLKGGAGNPSGK